MKEAMFHHFNPDECTACTVCTVHCPVAAATTRFRGPKMTGPAFERFRLFGLHDDASVEYCSNCKNCDISCPSGVPVSTFNMLARAAYRKDGKIPLRDLLTGFSGDIGRLARHIPAFLLNFGMKNSVSRFLLDAVGLDKRAPLPSFAPLRERRRLAGRRPSADAVGKGDTVALFPGCFVSYYEPRVGLDIITLLEKAGYGVIVPKDFVCCGLPLLCGGLMEAAQRRAEQNLREVVRLAEQGIAVVSPCPSCALMIGREYQALFPGEIIGSGIAPVHEAAAFALALVERGRLDISAIRPVTGRLAYHAPCHLRALGMGRPGFEILRQIPGVRIEDVNAGCCGLAGSYGMKKGRYEIGAQTGSALFAAIGETGAGLCVSECGSCRTGITRGTGLPAVHPLSLLACAL
ncbi:MAG: anaerobic glycerol-3-phosphate dehydrogenase subunit C [Desulfovibrio sp.]|jgi:glycerol-3-phosphate dehydrogenase subunit C|nr:anaerobic glycerol-3-phosphate dehydrogenase subunit C [Desulfovibrio sp.]